MIGRHLPGLSREPGFINFGQNSGYQAINLAYHLGARRMILVGFDMKAAGGQQHWFGEHPRHIAQRINFGNLIAKFGPLAADLKALGVEVINCSMGSALPYFTKRPLAEVVCGLS